MLGLNNIYCMDNISGSKLLDNDCIDLVVTSPPYDNLRKYKGFEWNFEGLVTELYRVIKPGGVIVWVVADATIDGSETGTSFRQALHFMSSGFNLHDTMLYAKLNPIPLQHRRYEQGFEYMFIFSKGVPKTFNPIRVPTKTPGEVDYRYKHFNYNEDTAVRNTQDRITITKETKLKSNIWYYPIGTNTKHNKVVRHPAVFPLPLVKDHITSWSNTGDTVLDPFMGSGTVGVACKELGRNYIGFEIAQEYCDLANKELNEI